jgi:hypothetical protein
MASDPLRSGAPGFAGSSRPERGACSFVLPSSRFSRLWAHKASEIAVVASGPKPGRSLRLQVGAVRGSSTR